MLLRPATPLSIVLFAAFAMLLLSVLSAPVISAITIATYQGVQFGVFGYCSKGVCSKVQIGYQMDDALRDANSDSSDFSLPSNARNSLTKLLIVHPVAAFLTLILFILSVLAHLHGPGHSPKYLLCLLILCLPTMLVSLLAFLVDILIFLPHVSWAGWLVLASTILIAIAGIAVCGIRRTVTGRIARSKRIQENAEMNGQSIFNNNRSTADAAPGAKSDGKLPDFATFETLHTSPTRDEGERIPLNPRNRAGSPPAAEDGAFTRSNTLKTDASDRSIQNYGPPPRGAGPLGPHMAGPAHGPGFVRNQYPDPSVSSGSGAPFPPRNGGFGRGPPPNFDPNQNRYGPPGPPGYRGGPTPPGGFNPRRGPPQGYGPPQGRGYGPPEGRGYGPPRGGMAMGMGMGPRRPPPPQGYDRGQEPDFPADISGPSNERAEFEQTLGLAVPGHGRTVSSDQIGLARSDDGSAEEAAELPATAQASREGSNEHVDGEGAYVPPRAQWSRSPQQQQQQAPAELPTSLPSRTPSSKSNSPPRHSGSYYEDVAPQFDTSTPPPPPPINTQHPGTSGSPHPPSLTPGGQIPGGPWSPPPIPDDEPQGPRSPALSSASGFTSISQRGVNPRWVEENGGLGAGRANQRVPSVGLSGNPDFELPGPRPGGRGRGRGRGGWR